MKPCNVYARMLAGVSLKFLCILSRRAVQIFNFSPHLKLFTVSCGVIENCCLFSLFIEVNVAHKKSPTNKTAIGEFKMIFSLRQSQTAFAAFVFDNSEEGKWPSNSNSLCNLLCRDRKRIKLNLHHLARCAYTRVINKRSTTNFARWKFLGGRRVPRLAFLRQRCRLRPIKNSKKQKRKV